MVNQLRLQLGRFGAPATVLCSLLGLLTGGCNDLTGIGRSSAPEILWRTELDPRDQVSDEMPATDGIRVYAVTGSVSAWDAGTGALLWRHRLSKTVPRNVVVSNQRVLGVEAIAFALDAATGRELWRFVPESSGAFGQSAVDERAFYFGTEEHRIHALDQATGTVLWSTDVGPDWQYDGTVRGVSVSGDTLYAAVVQYNAQNGYVSTGWIFALDKTTGRILWSYRNGDGRDRRSVFRSPTIAGRLLLASDLFAGAFFAVDRFTGKEVWRITGPADRPGPAHAPIVVDQTAYVASNDFHVYAVDLESGRVLWKTSTGSSNHDFTVCGNRIFVGHLALTVLDRRTGKVIHRRAHDTDFPTSGFTTWDDRVFFFGSKAAYAYICG